MGDDPGCREVVLGELRIEPRDHLGLALDLVHGVIGRERGHVAVDVPLELHHRLVTVARGRPAALVSERGDLPEHRRCLGRPGAEGRAVDDADPLGEDAEPTLPEQLAGVVLDLLKILGAFDEDVGDGEGVVEGERGVVAAGADLLGPDPARHVEQQPAAVPLAVDVAGAVEHLLAGRGRPARSGRGSASRPCGPRRRSRRRPCPRRWGARRAAGRGARASSGRGHARREAHGTGVQTSLTSRVPRLLRAGARRVDESAAL